jgi:hypothetical protein
MSIGPRAMAQPMAMVSTVEQNAYSAGAFEIEETTFQVGSQTVDRFRMHRWRHAHAHHEQFQGALLLLSGLAANFRTFEISPDGDVRDSLAAYFARRGFVVYGYSPRAALLPLGACESGALDCSPIENWDIQSMVDDIAVIRDRIAADFPRLPVVIGGLSLGAINAIASLDQHPHDYDGAVIWEGALLSDDPAMQALNAGYCQAVEARFNAGVFYDGQMLPLFKQVAAASETAPGQASPFAAIFGLPAGTTNHQMFVFLLATQPIGPGALFAPGYRLLAGSFAEDRFYYADERRVAFDIANFNNYIAWPIVRDIHCSLAGAMTVHTDELDQFDGPILAIRSGLGFGPYMQANLDAFTNADVRSLTMEEFGHVDHLFLPTPFHQLYVEGPIFRWLQSRVLRN